METQKLKNTIRFPLLALIFTWASFMVAIYIGIRNPMTTYNEQGQPIEPEPYVGMQTYVFLLGIAVFSIVALMSLLQALSIRARNESSLAKAAHRFNNLGVILSLLAGAIFAIGNFLGAWNQYNSVNDPALIRFLNVYLPIILATALVVFVLLQAFVFRKDAPDIPDVEKDVDRAKLQRAIGLAYASPIIGTAIAIIFGLIVYDITKTDLDTWIWVVIQVIIATQRATSWSCSSQFELCALHHLWCGGNHHGFCSWFICSGLLGLLAGVARRNATIRLRCKDFRSNLWLVYSKTIASTCSTALGRVWNLPNHFD
jgi:hypothetical protein